MYKQEFCVTCIGGEWRSVCVLHLLDECIFDCIHHAIIGYANLIYSQKTFVFNICIRKKHVLLPIDFDLCDLKILEITV